MREIVGILLATGSRWRFGSETHLYPLTDGTPTALAAARRLAEVYSRTVAVWFTSTTGVTQIADTVDRYR